MTIDERIQQAPPKAGLNWYRGFYRAWAVISLLWLLLGTGFAGYITWEQWWFTRNLAQTRAAEAAEKAKNHTAEDTDFIPWINKHTGKPCTEATAEFMDIFCSADPQGPWPANEIALTWAVMPAPVVFFYGLLRGGAWILRGFRRS